MSFNIVLFIYILLGIFLLVTVIVSISNWFKLQTTSFELNKLQIEIEKKTLEFDLLKNKEKPPTPLADKNSSPVMDTSSHRLVKNPNNQSNIEIVRNVRQNYTIDNSHKVVISPSETIPSPAKELNQTSAAKNNILEKDDEVLDIVEDSKPNSLPNILEPKTITVSLYSDCCNDADFINLQDVVYQALKKNGIINLVIDFSKILFLYEKEILLLKKIHLAILSQKGSLSFQSCNKELTSILSKDETLTSLIRKV